MLSTESFASAGKKPGLGLRGRWVRLRLHARRLASIGANATVVCGHRIGRCAMIGAGAVVTTDVPPHALMLGVPARQHGFVCTCGQRLKGESLECTACGRRFEKDGDGLKEL